jgi:hypothetical protein
LDNVLEYTIRFQNTGNDTAYHITIRDTLDENLDLSTLEIIGASHPFEAFLKPDRTLEFKFANIQLPDSAGNEMNSHGFASYSIKPIADTPLPVIIENTAFIYFDFNAAIKTNTAINAFEDLETSVHGERKLVDIITAFPNPTADEIYIKSITQETGPIAFNLFAMDGQWITSGLLNTDETQRISLKEFPSGLYLLKVAHGDSLQTIMLFKG